jgi:hypothetical protein
MACGERNSSLGSRWTARSGRATSRRPPLVGERNGQQVVGNLRVGEVLQVSSLVGSHNRTEVELIGDFEMEAFAFVHRIRGSA